MRWSSIDGPAVLVEEDNQRVALVAKAENGWLYAVEKSVYYVCLQADFLAAWVVDEVVAERIDEGAAFSPAIVVYYYSL